MRFDKNKTPVRARAMFAAVTLGVMFALGATVSCGATGYCGDLMKVSKNGGVPVTLAASQKFAQPGLAVDATSVYWVSTGGVVRVAK